MSLSARISKTPQMLTWVLLLAGTARAQWEYPDWHQAVVDWCSTSADEAYFRSDDSAQLAWGETYVLQTYLWMFHVDADTIWLHRIVEHAYSLMRNARDVPSDSTADPVYRDGYRGWGTSHYSEHYEEWLVHDGHVCSELARFVKTVYNDDQLYAWFGERADSVLHFLERNVAAKWHSTWYTPRAELPGDIDMNATYSHWIGGQNLLTFPTNHFTAFGDFLLQLWQISGMRFYQPTDPDLVPWYRQVVDDVADAFRSVLHYDPVLDAYIWSYAGHTGGNDISHAAIELRFAYDCYWAGIHFDERDMQRFAHTLTRRLWANPPDIWNAHLFSHFSGEGDTRYEIYTRNWPLLGFFDPLVYAVEAGVLRKNAAEPQNLPSPSTAAALANLAYVANAAPPLVKVLGITLRERQGDGDNLLDPGEVVDLHVQVANWGPMIDTLRVTFACPDKRVLVENPTAVFALLANHDTTGAHKPAIRLREQPDVETGGTLQCEVTFQEGDRVRRECVRLHINPSEILLVDDDGGQDLEQAYQDSVLETLAAYQVWHRDTFGAPDSYLGKYGTVVWLTGQNPSPLMQEDRRALASYVNAGGTLVLFGPRVEDALLDGASPDSAFFRDILHARPSDEARSLPFLTLFVRDQTFYPSPYLTISAGDSVVFRAVEPGPDARVLVSYAYGPAGIYTSAHHKVAYLTFGLEQVSSHDPVAQLQKRRRVLEGILTLLRQPTAVRAAPRGHGPEAFRLHVYPNPSRGSVLLCATAVSGVRRQLVIFDVRGRAVKRWRALRSPRLRWDGTDDNGQPLPSGLYIVRLEASGQVATQKVVLVR